MSGAKTSMEILGAVYSKYPIICAPRLNYITSTGRGVVLGQRLSESFNEKVLKPRFTDTNLAEVYPKEYKIANGLGALFDDTVGDVAGSTASRLCTHVLRMLYAKPAVVIPNPKLIKQIRRGDIRKIKMVDLLEFFLANKSNAMSQMTNLNNVFL